MNKVIMNFGEQKAIDTTPPNTTNITAVNATTTTLNPGESATVAAILTGESLRFLFGIPQGETGNIGPTGPQGETGNGIASVELISGTHAPGTTDTYKITFTDGSSTTFNIYNGEDGTDGETGNGIASVELLSGTHAPGTTDTYKITFTDGSDTTFTVYNGADGAGAGDMTKAVYDKKTLGLDVFGYADGMLGKTTTFNADGSITETTTAWSKLTTFNADGSITERISYADDSWRQKTTTFNADGSITETITEGTA